MEVILNGGELYSFDFRPIFAYMVGLTVNSNADNAKISWRIILRINGLLKVCPFIILLVNLRKIPAVLIGKKNLEVRPTAVNKVRLDFCDGTLTYFFFCIG